MSLLSCILFQSSLQLDESSPNWYFCLYFNQVLQLDESASNWYFCCEKQKNKHSIHLSLYPEWLKIALYKDSRFPAHEMVFLRYFAMFGKRYGDVYRHALPSVIAKLEEANLAKYTYTGKREEKEWKNFFFKNDVVLNSWNSTSMNLHPRAITLQLNFSENNCSGGGREREKGSASRAAFSPISDF